MKETEQLTLTREQKESLGLLSIGTFLEYFDLMLYVHMAVLLNDIFFPKTDQFTATLLATFAFCSTYFLRPIGALIFGYIGDNFGRKISVIITTGIMALSCVIISLVPSYKEIGITASYIITICRILQGMSSMGEIVGAEIYVTEITKPPVQYPAVTIISIFSILGANFALATASFVLGNNINWRGVFFIGAVIALVGFFARSALRETAEFADARKRLGMLKELNSQVVLDKFRRKIAAKTSLALFAIQCGWPFCFYFSYVYCGQLLKQNCMFTPDQVIKQNFIVSIINLLGYIVITFLCTKFSPLRILMSKGLIFIVISFSLPFVNMADSINILIIQSLSMLFVLSCTGAMPVFLKHLPVLKRFTVASMIYALSRSFSSLVLSFGLVIVVSKFPKYGIPMVMLPITLAFIWGVTHFVRLEREPV